MKRSKGIIKVSFVLLLLLFNSCKNDIAPTSTVNKGALVIASDPQGAEIYLEDQNTGEITPAEFKDLTAGDYKVTLKLSPFNDSTFNVNIQNDLSRSISINLVFPFKIETSYQIVPITYSLGSITSDTTIFFHFFFEQAIILNDISVYADSLVMVYGYGNKEMPKNSSLDFDGLPFFPGNYNIIFSGTITGYDTTTFRSTTHLNFK